MLTHTYTDTHQVHKRNTELLEGHADRFKEETGGRYEGHENV